ncbi:MAG: NepR family anti-sigma factor [Methylocystis sp.]
MSQRENQHDNEGPCRDADSDIHRAAGGGENEVDGSGADGAMLDPKIQAQLGRVFRAYCDDLIHQPIPDKFTVLLAKLEAKQREKK